MKYGEAKVDKKVLRLFLDFRHSFIIIGGFV